MTRCHPPQLLGGSARKRQTVRRGGGGRRFSAVAACRRCGETTRARAIVGVSPPTRRGILRCVGGSACWGLYSNAAFVYRSNFPRCTVAIPWFVQLSQDIPPAESSSTARMSPLCFAPALLWHLTLFLFTGSRHGAVGRRFSVVISNSVVFLADIAAAAHLSARSMLDLRLYVRRIAGYWTALKRPTASCSTYTSGERAEKGCDHARVVAGAGLLIPDALYARRTDTVDPTRCRCTTYTFSSTVDFETSVPRCTTAITPMRREATRAESRRRQETIRVCICNLLTTKVTIITCCSVLLSLSLAFPHPTPPRLPLPSRAILRTLFPGCYGDRAY